MEARSPDCRSNVQKAPRRRPVAGRARFPYAARGFGGTTRRPAVAGVRTPRPAGRSHYVVISRDERKLVTRDRVMLP